MTATDWTTLLWWIGGGLFAVAGIALLIIALLGDCFRTRKTRPRRCPKCWYNLSGTESLKCSECGHEVDDERNLRKARRRWRWALIAIALILTGGGVIGWQQTRGYDWNRIKPVWLLKREGHGLTARAYAARSELVRRILEDSRSHETIHTLYDHAMTLQADPEYAWMDTTNWPATLNTWGDIVETTHDMEAITAEQFAAYLEQAFRPHIKLVTRPVWREGVPIQICFEYEWPRASGQPRWQVVSPERMLMCDGDVASIDIGGQTVGTREEFGYISVGRSTAPSSRRFSHVEGEFAAGKHGLTSRWQVSVRHGFRAQQRVSSRGFSPRWKEVTPITSWEMPLECRFEVVPSGQSTVQLVANESKRKLIRDAIRIELRDNRIGNYGPPGVYGQIVVDPLPVNLSFDVYCRSGDEVHLVGTLVSRKTDKDAMIGSKIDVASPKILFPNAQTVDIILRSNPMPAEHTIDIFDAWDGEIVFENVPLRELQKGTITGNGPDS